MQNRRVVVTGIGVVSSIGIGKNEFWNNLISGKSGISEVEAFDTSKYENHRGGEVKNFNPSDFIDQDKIRNTGRASQFGIAAAKLALEDGRLNMDSVVVDRVGAIMGTTMADSQRLEEMDKAWIERGEEGVASYLISQYPGNSISSSIGYELNIKGVVSAIPTACSAGNYSIGYSYDLIRTGKMDAVLAGGSDSFSRVAFTGFNRLFAVAPEKCQPFDKNRKGMIVGEGAGVLLLESLDGALNRKAEIYAEILGYAMSCDAHHMTAPSVDGIAKVMVRALKHSKIGPNDVDYISAHGTGTSANDKAECRAVAEVFKERSRKIPINSIKSMLGHTMGAASAIEAIVCCLAINEGIIPPTINYETPDPECDIDCVPNKSRKHNVRIALNNSLAFGGNNACLVVRTYA